jgi:hypothetical protein
VVDALLLGVPMLLWQGDRWFNRIGSAILRSVSSDLAVDLVTVTEQEFVDRLRTLLLSVDDIDNGELATLRQRMSAIDVDTALFSGDRINDEADGMANAFNYLVRHHSIIKQHSNARIKANYPPTPVYLGKRNEIARSAHKWGHTTTSLTIDDTIHSAKSGSKSKAKPPRPRRNNDEL